MEQAKNETTSVALETIITNAVKIPGVKVNRSKFLAEAFAGDDIDLQTIIDMGPVSAGIPQERIRNIIQYNLICTSSNIIHKSDPSHHIHSL